MKVLIVDGIRMFQQLVSSLFENTGLDPEVAANGEECLKALSREKYQFICISMHLEDTNGVELCKAIRNTQEHAFTPIILFTSEHSNQMLSRAIAAGVTEIFNKSKDLDQLVAYVKRFTLQHSPLEGRVLYAEDSKSLRMNTKEILRSKGLEVDSFSKAETAWEVFQTQNYDLVITDILLAGHMSGLAFVNKIRRMADRRGDTPILAVTGFDDIARRIELFHMGVNDYAIKPLIEEELIARVRYLINTSKSVERQLGLIRSIFEYSPNAVVIFDHKHLIEQANEAFLTLTLNRCEEVIGQDLGVFQGSSIDGFDLQDIWRIVETEGHWDGLINLAGDYGEDRKCFATFDIIESSTGVMKQFMAIFREKR